MIMAFNKLLTRQQVIEAYQIPKELEQEIFLVLRPVFGAGDDAMYQESLVDKQLHHYGLKKLRLQQPDTEFSHKEDSKMIALNQQSDPLDRIAQCVERLIEVLVPKTADLVGTEYIASRLGVSKQWVGKMADKGTIPKNCIAPKVSGGRVWKFHRDRIDAWLEQS